MTPATHEDLFWALKGEALTKGITPARMGQLAKFCNDWPRAYQSLKQALGTKHPSSYLGAMIKSLKNELHPSISIKDEPDIALQGRLHGWPVRKTALSNGEPAWWVAGVLYDKAGIDVGG